MSASKSMLEQELHDAMRSGDKLKKNTLRMVLTAVKLAEVDVGRELDQDGIQRVLQKEAKARRETIADAEAARRDDLRAEAEAELQLLESYLPEQLTDDEIRELARGVITETGASGPEDMGRVMGAVMGQIQGRAEGGRVSDIVRAELSGP